MKHLITDIQRFSLNDGPGIRTTVFFKGCNMHCTWCHNPETLSADADILQYPAKCIGCGKCFAVCPSGAQTVVDGKHTIDREKCIKCGKCTEVCYAEALVKSGKEMTVEDIMFHIRQDKAYYDASGGGVTLSGGEVLCHVPFAVELARACHAEGISVAIESNLSFPYEHIKPLLDEVDVIMADIKLMDDEAHKIYTGISNKTVLENVKRIGNIPMIIRTPLIPGVTATKENLEAISHFLSGKEDLVYYQILNFNPLGASKYDGLSAVNDFRAARPYSDAEMKAFGEMAAAGGIRVKVGE